MKIVMANDFIEGKNKAEILDEFREVLNTEGARVVVIKAIPDDKNELEIYVRQSGHDYWYEAAGLIREGLKIIEGEEGEDIEDGRC